MNQLVFLLVASVLGIVVFKLRSDAAKERKAVIARLATEREERGDYSPTAELFREAGVPLEPVGAHQPVTPPPPAPIGDVDGGLPNGIAFDTTPTFERLSDVEAPVPAAPVVPIEGSVTEPTSFPAPPSDLRTLFHGISMPAGLKPLGPLVPVSASFVTEAAPAEVQSGLDAEFGRLACAARWVEPTIAETERNGMRGLVTIYPNPTAAIDLEGNPLFPGVEAGQVVVRMLAL